MADSSMLAAAKLLEPLAERVGHLEHVTQARSFLSQSLRNNESFDFHPEKPSSAMMLVSCMVAGIQRP
jgi:hypothetical protein